METTLLALWWLSGMGGASLLWLIWKINFPAACGRCPTRKGALAIFFAGILGLILLGASLLVSLFEWIEHRPKNPDGWWGKPLC